MIETTKKSIRVAFCDFYEGFDYKKFYLYNILKKYYDVIIDSEKPQYLIYSCYSSQFLRFKDCIRIFWTGEPVVPNFNFCDYSISFTRETFGGRNLFLPLSIWRIITSAENESDKVCVPPHNRKFCSFVYSNETFGEGAIYRKQFCKELMKQYKHVDCAGRVLHNFDSPQLSARNNEKNWHKSKIEYLSGYKFNIAFENSNSDGYITEKLVDPFMANSVPIYWGSEGNILPFSKNALICANDFSNLNDLIKYVKYVDEHDEVYNEILKNNPLNHESFTTYKEEIENFIINIIEKGKYYYKSGLKLDPLHRVSDIAILPDTTLLFLRRVLRGYNLFHNIFK